MRIEHVALYVKDKYRKKIQSSHSMSFTRLQRTESEIRSGQGNNREKDNDRKREETVDPWTLGNQCRSWRLLWPPDFCKLLKELYCYMITWVIYLSIRKPCEITVCFLHGFLYTRKLAMTNAMKVWKIIE